MGATLLWNHPLIATGYLQQISCYYITRVKLRMSTVSNHGYAYLSRPAIYYFRKSREDSFMKLTVGNIRLFILLATLFFWTAAIGLISLIVSWF